VNAIMLPYLLFFAFFAVDALLSQARVRPAGGGGGLAAAEAGRARA
jgi:hypothetical protein